MLTVLTKKKWLLATSVTRVQSCQLCGHLYALTKSGRLFCRNTNTKHTHTKETAAKTRANSPPAVPTQRQQQPKGRTRYKRRLGVTHKRNYTQELRAKYTRTPRAKNTKYLPPHMSEYHTRGICNRNQKPKAHTDNPKHKPTLWKPHTITQQSK